MQKMKVKGHSIPKAGVETDGRTDKRTETIALHSSLMQSVLVTSIKITSVELLAYYRPVSVRKRQRN